MAATSQGLLTRFPACGFLGVFYKWPGAPDGLTDEQTDGRTCSATRP